VKYDLTLADLDELDTALVAHLIAVGEPLHVERKRDIPPADKLGELIGSMANTEGGWAVLGVDDDGTLVGLQPSRTDLQDEVCDAVRKTLDPLPNFGARRVAHDGKEVGIVRVYRSEDTPHVSTHKGAVYVRMPGGKRPIQSRRELDALLARGQSTTGDAELRLASSPVAAAALNAADLLGERVFTEPVDREWVLSATPLGLDDGFRGRVQTTQTRDVSDAVAMRLLPHGSTGDEYPERRAISPGWISWGVRVGDRAAAAVIVDPAGIVCAVQRERGLRSLINQVLAATGTPGRCLCTLHARGFRDVVLQAVPDGSVPMPAGTRKSQVQPVSGTAGPDELRTVAKRLATDIAADAGLLAFS
jgi:Putative DNA-binding domain